MHTVVVTTHLA